MRIDIHCHTFNASDIPLIAFLGESRYATGIGAEAWYNLPEPLRNTIIQMFIGLVGRGPTAADELEALKNPPAGASWAGFAAKSIESMPPDLDAAGRLVLFDAFYDPGDRVPLYSVHTLLGMKSKSSFVPSEDEVYSRLVDYALPDQPGSDAPIAAPPDESDPDRPALLTPRQQEFWQWMPTLPEPAQADALRDIHIQAAVLEIQEEELLNRDGAQPALVAKTLSWSDGKNWIRRLVRRAVRWAKSTGRSAEEAVEEAIKLARGLGHRFVQLKDAAERVVAFIYLMRRSRHEIVNTLSSDYGRIQLFTPALVDYTAVTGERSASSLAEQVMFWEEFARRRARSAGAKPLVHPFFPIDPYWLIPRNGFDEARLRSELAKLRQPWPDGLQDPATMVRKPGFVFDTDPDVLYLMRYALEQAGFIGIKLYPPALFAPYGNKDLSAEEFPRIEHGAALDIVLEQLYEYCADNDVPILAHTSEGNEFAEGYGKLAGPTYWGKALAMLAKKGKHLRVCFGHFGHFHEDPAAPQGALDWGVELAKLMQQNAFVYGDVGNSEAPGNGAVKKRFLDKLKSLIAGNSRLPRRLLYGSDWMLNNLHAKYRSFFDDFEKTFTSDAALGGHVEAFLGGNAVRFLFLDQAGQVNQNHGRLCAFYQKAGAAVPELLTHDLERWHVPL